MSVAHLLLTGGVKRYLGPVFRLLLSSGCSQSFYTVAINISASELNSEFRLRNHEEYRVTDRQAGIRGGEF